MHLGNAHDKSLSRFLTARMQMYWTIVSVLEAYARYSFSLEFIQSELQYIQVINWHWYKLNFNFNLIKIYFLKKFIMY